MRRILWSILAIPFVMMATSQLTTYWAALVASLAVGACLMSAWVGASVVLGAIASLLLFHS